ncbi:LOW QUALITY PROTEIN: protein CASC3 [Ascaphus truei]|uniref:LOW QUALITY PROTEIN: protein CASC3 n=1 Tax=Ascaphus truei TaxID=8439 RepID=UPI003F5A65F4
MDALILISYYPFLSPSPAPAPPPPPPQESTEPDEDRVVKKSQKQLDDDEDRKNPAYIPRKGMFFEHDLRGQIHDEVRPKARHQRKLWKDEGCWVHDRFREDEQAPKSREELIALYGYDIRSCKNPEEIRQRQPRKPRFSSPSRREENWPDEKSSRPPVRYQDPDSGPPPRPYSNRSNSGSGGAAPSRSYPRPGGYRENRPGYRPQEDEAHHPTSERRQEYGGYRTRSAEHVPQRENSPELPNKTEGAPVPEPAPPPPDRPVERKSYSRARRSRLKGGEAGKGLDDAAFPELPPPPPPPPAPPAQAPELSPPSQAGKSDGWEEPPPAAGGELSRLEQEMSQVSVSEPGWRPGQPAYIPPPQGKDPENRARNPAVATGIPNHMHMVAGPPPQFSRMEGMGVPSGRVKRYSSQRQRPVLEPPPMHISIMEGHYYDPLQFQGPIYTQGDNPSPLPPQGMIVQPEMHLSHPGLHPHQSPAPMPAPNLYPAPVSLSPGQPPPQQLLPPPYFTAPPAVMNFGSPSYPYAPAGLPPPPPAHLYPNAQAQSQVYGGVTYYNPVQQQALPKPSPPRRTSQPVTVKPPPPEENRYMKAKDSSV